jgi:hypothetical protein
MNPRKMTKTKHRVAAHIEVRVRRKPTAHSLGPSAIEPIQRRRKNSEEQLVWLVPHNRGFDLLD